MNNLDNVSNSSNTSFGEAHLPLDMSGYEDIVECLGLRDIALNPHSIPDELEELLAEGKELNFKSLLEKLDITGYELRPFKDKKSLFDNIGEGAKYYAIPNIHGTMNLNSKDTSKSISADNIVIFHSKGIITKKLEEISENISEGVLEKLAGIVRY